MKSICLYCLWFLTYTLLSQYRGDCLCLQSFQAYQLAKASTQYKVYIVPEIRSHILTAMQYICLYWLRFSRYAVDSYSHNSQLLVYRLYRLYSPQTTGVRANFRHKYDISDKIPQSYMYTRILTVYLSE